MSRDNRWSSKSHHAYMFGRVVTEVNAVKIRLKANFLPVFPCKFGEICVYLQRDCSKGIDMKTAQEFLNIIKAHQSELQGQFGITSMRLFGSVARGEHHEGSDVDLFVTMPPKFYNYILAAQYLEELLGCNVDLIQEHRNMRPFFRQQIEQYGIDVF